MYISRYHFENDKISLSLDSKSGELIELINKVTGDNLIKSHENSCPPPFCLCLEDGATVTAPRRKDCMTDTSLAADIVCVEYDGAKLIHSAENGRALRGYKALTYAEGVELSALLEQVTNNVFIERV